MNNERKELASLFARYLDGTLPDDDTIETWERLSKSNDQTIVNGCKILADQIEDTMFDVDLLDKSEWDYIERVRLALLGNATIEKRKSFHFGWRNALSGFGFFVFIFLAIPYGIGYHLLPLTVFFALAIVIFSKFLPERNNSSPYQSIVAPFTSFSGLKSAYDNADGFIKRRYVKPTIQPNSFARNFWMLVACCLIAVLSPVMLLVLAFPDTDPTYQAIAG